MKFSITIPAFKKKFLKEAIDSVCQQTYTDWELIIVDDFSPEDLQSIVKPYLQDKRIHYYRNDKNCGAINVVDNWNLCLSHCTGDFVICIGDDDRFLPCCLQEYVNLIKAYPQLNIYHTATEIIDEHGIVKTRQRPRPQWESAISLIWNRWNNRDKQFIGDFCYRRAFLISIGGYYKLPLAWGSDDITAVIAAAEKGIANTQKYGFQYRENSLTITQSGNSEIKMNAAITQFKWYNDFLHSISAENLSTSDKEYLQSINAQRDIYYYRALGQYCSNYMKGNPLKILHCKEKLSIFHLSTFTLIRFYITSLKNIIFK